MSVTVTSVKVKSIALAYHDVTPLEPVPMEQAWFDAFHQDPLHAAMFVHKPDGRGLSVQDFLIACERKNGRFFDGKDESANQLHLAVQMQISRGICETLTARGKLEVRAIGVEIMVERSRATPDVARTFQYSDAQRPLLQGIEYEVQRTGTKDVITCGKDLVSGEMIIQLCMYQNQETTR
jgi:hypothetical protein